MKKKNSNVLIGLQYGDEGKARVLDKIAAKSNVIARFNGGANAGHTLEVEGKKVVLHQIPSGIFHENMLLYMGSGCVISPEKLNVEINNILNVGIDISDRLKISGKITLIQPHHVLLDEVFGKDLGTTKNGIGFAYSDQAIRSLGKRLKNLRFADYITNPEFGLKVIKDNLLEAIDLYKIDFKENVDDVVLKYNNYVLKLKGYLEKDSLFLENLVEDGNHVLYEGAQSVMLDVISGTVPYVTSSRTVAGAAYTGGDVSIKHHNKTIGIAKAIMSRVGNGPFISEFGGNTSEKYCAKDEGNAHSKEFENENYDADKLLKSNDMLEVGIGLRMNGGEYGATTKRPRRIGMLDLVMLRQNCKLNGVDDLYINKFDCLVDFAKSSLSGIPLVVGYELDGKKIDYIPSTSEESARTKPIIEYLDFIEEDISSIRDYSKLPDSVKKLIKYIEEFVGAKLRGIGVGPERDQFVYIE